MTQTIVLYRFVGTVEVTFNLFAAKEVDLFQLCQGLEALEVACSRRARVRGFQHGQLSRNVVALRQPACDIYRYRTARRHHHASPQPLLSPYALAQH